MQPQSLRQLIGQRIREQGPMRFDDYVDLALYEPQFGYYRRPQIRVGRNQESDFYTSTSITRLFGPLLVEACRSLLPYPLEEVEFVEVGSEPSGSVITGELLDNFAAVRTIRYGEDFVVGERPCILFSNELFDAQPFRRLHFRNQIWFEGFVDLDAEQLVERLMPIQDHEQLPFPPYTPAGDYTLDWPERASTLCTQLAGEHWQGLWLCMDYGLDRETLLHERPQGTARSYRKHRQSNALLEDPGECDLTCHICWSDIEETLQANGFGQIRRQSQESFFMHHSMPLIQKILTDNAGEFSRDRQSLKELLHPQHLGGRFQALSAVRTQ